MLTIPISIPIPIPILILILTLTLISISISFSCFYFFMKVQFAPDYVRQSVNTVNLDHNPFNCNIYQQLQHQLKSLTGKLSIDEQQMK